MKKVGYFVTSTPEGFVDINSLKGSAKDRYDHQNILEADEIELARTRAATIAEETPGSVAVVYEVIFKPVVIFKSEVVVTQSNVGLDEPEPVFARRG
jgi:hypothetical protein